MIYVNYISVKLEKKQLWFNTLGALTDKNEEKEKNYPKQIEIKRKLEQQYSYQTKQNLEGITIVNRHAPNIGAPQYISKC